MGNRKGQAACILVLLAGLIWLAPVSQGDAEKAGGAGTALLTRPTAGMAGREDYIEYTGSYAGEQVTERGSLPEATPDADLKSGFPVSTYNDGGGYSAGAVNNVLVGNVDSDPRLEIFVSAYWNGPQHAWHADGSPVAGWPPTGAQGVGYSALGHFSLAANVFDVFTAYLMLYGQPTIITAYSGAGVPLPGWPRNVSTGVAGPAALVDVDGDGIDEIFIGLNDAKLHAFHADGTELPGWPVTMPSTYVVSPALADLDGDREVEVIVTNAGPDERGRYLLAFHLDGTPVSGFPVFFPVDIGFAHPAIGDVDGDRMPEIAIVVGERPGSFRGLLKVVSASGVVERTLSISGNVYGGSAVALADLDADLAPEMIVQADGAISIYRGDGSSYPGWPRVKAYEELGNSSPVVGDIDGDGQPDIVATGSIGAQSGWVNAYSRDGQMLAGFPKLLPLGHSMMPAIADIDLDGRNDLIVGSVYWAGSPQVVPQVWAYDANDTGSSGRIEWGQFMGGPGHQGLYRSPFGPRCADERFTDVCRSDYFYEPVLSLNDDGIVAGYTASPPCDNYLHVPCFKPYNNITRGQVAKIVALAAGVSEPVGGQTFEDIEPSHTFYQYIEQLAAANVVSGYACGGPSEPCIAPLNRSYFRPGNAVSRGQVSKMITLAFSFSEPASGQMFEDVAAGSTFYEYVQTLAGRGIINGYQCGAQGEPCVPPHNRPYFRPSNTAARGQTAKIVHASMILAAPTPAPTPSATPSATASAVPSTTPEASATPTATQTPSALPTSSLTVVPQKTEK